MELADALPQREYAGRLERVPRLRDLAGAHAVASHAGPAGPGESHPAGSHPGAAAPGTGHASSVESAEVALHMEFLLEGLHQNSLLAKVDLDSGSSYRDMLKEMFEQMAQTTED